MTNAGGRPTSTTSSSAAFMLRGMLRCGDCGCTLLSHAPGRSSAASARHGGWYMCRNRAEKSRAAHPCLTGPIVRHVMIDRVVDNFTLNHIEGLAARLARPEAPPAPPKGAPDFKAKRSRIDASRARIVDAIAEGTITREMARAKLGDLEAALVKIDREEAEHAPPPAAPTRPRAERLAEVRELGEAWSHLNTDEKRTIIKSLTNAIIITSAGKILPDWKQA